MQTFGLNYDVKPECTEDFIKALMQLIDTMNRCDGHIETRLFSDVAQPNSMMIYSNWKTKAEFVDFVRSDSFDQAKQEAVGMLESKPSLFAGQDIRLIKPAE
jgi:heme-degrading monooxygenase HmoA